MAQPAARELARSSRSQAPAAAARRAVLANDRCREATIVGGLALAIALVASGTRDALAGFVSAGLDTACGVCVAQWPVFVHERPPLTRIPSVDFVEKQLREARQMTLALLLLSTLARDH